MTVTLEDLDLIPSRADKASDNVTAWTENVLPILQAGGTVAHGDKTFYIDDALPGPTSPGWTYLTVEGQSTFEQITNNREILLFTCSQSNPGDFQTRVCPAAFFLGGFVARWTNDQPKANTRAIAVAFKATGAVPDGVYNWYMGPGFMLYNGRDGIAIHPDTVTAGYEFPVWGATIESPKMAGLASGSLLRLGNFGPGGAPKIIVRGTPYIDGAGNDGTIPLIHLRHMTGWSIYDLEINRCKQNALFFEEGRIGLLINPRWESVLINQPLLGVVRSTGINSRVTIQGAEIYNLSANPASGGTFFFETYGGDMRIIDLALGEVRVPAGSFYPLWPWGGGRIILDGRPYTFGAHESTGWTYIDDALGVEGARGETFVALRAPLAANIEYLAVDPLRQIKPLQAGYVRAMKYEFLDAAGLPVTVTAGSGSIQILKNAAHFDTPSALDYFNSSTNNQGGNVILVPLHGSFMRGDVLTGLIQTDSSFATSSAAILRVTIWVAYH